MVVDGTGIVDELALKALKANPNFKGNVVRSVLNVTSVTVANNLNFADLLTASARVFKTNGKAGLPIKGQSTGVDIVKFLIRGPLRHLAP